MNKIIIMLVRKKLGLKKYEQFRFVGQLSPYHYYYFTDEKLIKVVVSGPKNNKIYKQLRPSGVSLNYIISDECEIVKVGDYEKTQNK